MEAQGKMAVQWLLDQKLPEYMSYTYPGSNGQRRQIGRTKPLDEQFANGTMKCGSADRYLGREATAKRIVESVINSGEKFNVVYAENDGMAKAQLQLSMKQVSPR